MKFMRSLLLMSGLLLSLTPAQAHNYHAHGNALAVQSITAAELPREARDTLRLIKQGGPFPFPRDGVVFGNREQRLPAQPRGYYHEYTVKTPGAHDRGARRIVCGQLPECYYSDDHYRSFRLITGEH